MFMKRIVSLVLLLSLVFGMLPATAQAAENQATLDTTNTTIEGTNSFGTLLSQDLQQEQTEETNPQIALYNVIDLTVENGMVTAEFYTQKEAELVVAVYTEDEQQLLLSGKTVVQPEETTASVLLEGELPEYFVLSAYLLDPFDYAPLCEAYSTPMYTREMQQLLDSTVDDYDPDRVLNLDEDKTTNFAVYAENIKVIDFVPGVNTVVSADDENAVYVIKNADANITGLRRGDIMAYTYGREQLLLVKVAKVMVSGTTATIIGDQLEMEDVFSYVKIEQTGDAADFEVDETTIEEGIVYEGTWQESDQSYPDDYTATGEEPLSYPDSHLAAEGDVTWENYLYFRFVDKKLDYESEEFETAAKFNGDIGISLDVKVSYYIALTQFFLKFDLDAGIKAQFTASGEAKGKLPLPEFKLSFFGTSIGFEPELQVEFKGEAECAIFLGAKIGFSARVIFGVLLFQAPYFHFDADADIKAEATVFLGVDLAPQLDVFGGALAEAKVEMPVGFEVKAAMDGRAFNEINDTDSEEGVIHSCEKCVKIERNLKAELSVKMELLKSKKLRLESKLKDIEINLGEWYWSIDHNERGPGKCPYKSYRVTVYVEDAQEEPVAEALISAATDDGEQTVLMGQTDRGGIAVAYLPPANYVFTASVKGEAYETTETVEEACKVSISMDDTLLGAGICGKHVEWALFSDGLLRIYGWGEMYDYDSVYNKIDAPWFSMTSKIKEVLIEERVTSIGSCAFHWCDMVNVTIPESVTSIGRHAFAACYNLSSITIPASITYIGESAFNNRIKSVYISDLTAWCNIYFADYAANPMLGGAKLYLNNQLVTDMVIPNGVDAIRDFAFYGCTSLTDVTIRRGVTAIGEGAFRECVNVKRLTIADSVTAIGESAFRECVSLTRVSIPDSVTSIGGYAFLYCSGLTKVALPAGLSGISSGVFHGCTRLPEIDIPSSVKSIGSNAFRYCYSLTNVTIPDNVRSIGVSSFGECTGLERVTIGKGCTSITWHAFEDCSNLREIVFTGNQPWFVVNREPQFYAYHPFGGVTAKAYYPANNTTWKKIEWSDAGGNLTWVAYEPGTMAPAVAAPEELLVEMPLQLPEEVLSESVASPEDAAATGTVRTASFAELNPGESYVLLVLAAAAAEDLLAAENLLYIDQAAAEQDGTLTFSYIQRVETEDAFVMLCGATDRDLQDARITFPEMEPSDTLQVVDPTVVLGDKVLVEGQDYVITGTVDYTALGVYTCCVRGINHYTGAVSCTYRVGDPAALFATDTGGCYYTTVAEALQQGDGTVSLVKQVREDLTVSCNTVLDLNGYTLDGSVTAATGMLTVKDSQTDDFTVEDDFGYGRITGQLTGVQAADGYVMVNGPHGSSFHRVELELTAMTLRPSVAGVYYHCQFSGDEVLMEDVTRYGVALSVEGDPATVRATYADFGPGSNAASSALLTGIMKTTNTPEVNAQNAEMQIYGRIYLETADRQYVFGSCVSRSLRQQVELIDLQWGQLSDLQQEAVLSMYRTYASVMQSWQIPNILSAQAAG